jgi:cytochrome P450
MFEVDLGQGRVIVLCKANLIENVSSANTKYPIRFKRTDGFIEYGLDKSALGFNYIDHKTWKYNRQIFNQALMTPNFNNQAIEWTSEIWDKMESYWNKLGENHELDLTKWVRRFTTDMIFRIATGVKNDSLTPYYNTFILEKNNDLNEKINEDSENLIQSITTFIGGISYFIIFNNFMRHYVPFVRGKGKKLLKNRDYLFDRLYDIIRKKRIEIENTPLDQPFRQDMLTSCITANTPRDINAVKHTDAGLLRPMTDDEIFSNTLDVMLGGTDTVNFIFIYFTFFFFKKKPCINSFSLKYRRRIHFVLLYIISDIITK